MMPFFRKWPSPGLNKQSWCWKNFLWVTFLPDTATQCQVIDFFYHHDLAKILFFIQLHVLSRKSHDVDFCMWSLSECNTKLWMLQFRIRKITVFLPLGFDFPQLLNKFCVVLSVFWTFSCKSFSDIAKKYVWALNVLTGKINFIMDKRNLW